jgi:hypothetical protein
MGSLEKLIFTCSPLKHGGTTMKFWSKAVVSVLAIMILVTLFAYVFLIGGQKQSRGGENLAISDLERLADAPRGDLFFLYWTNHSSDMLAAKSFYDACKNPSEIFYEPGDNTVDETGYPRPEAFGRGKYLVLFGGPSVQPITKHYEDYNVTPISISAIDSTHFVCINSQGREIFIYSLEFDEHHDIFIIEFFVDKDGRNVFVCYGWGWQGTFAGATYLVQKITRNINDYQHPSYVFRWADTNNNCVPEANEIFEEKQVYTSVQVTLHRTADQNTVEWFADACHSQGLNVTWYVVPEGNGKLTSLLKGFMNLGDDVELSFGPVFFSQMGIEERTNRVINYLNDFKRQFEFYPTLVEAYYIDAFTLSYIASHFPFIKGAVGYANHEEFCDGLKTAGAYYMPYYPSMFNALVPGEGEDKIPIVMLPFAHRDLSNNVLFHDVRYNLSPQDGMLLVDNWRQYFDNLFKAYLDGWDQFGLALYLVDLTFLPLPRATIEEDLNFIHAQIESQSCRNILDKDFVKWFSEKYVDSPCYRWIYNDPRTDNFSSIWYFTHKERVGQIFGKLSEIREFSYRIEEACYDEPVVNYDNSFRLR